jgi:HK97 family phage portal protein
MSIFSRALRRIKNLGLNDPKAWNPSLWNLFGSQSISGEVVDEYTALTYSAFWNAITLISGTIGALPLHLMEQKGEKKRIANNLTVYEVLHSRANPYMTAMSFRECITAHVLTWGNGYAEIVRDGLGDVRELWPITPNRVRPVMDDAELFYRVSMPNGEDKYLPRNQVLHLAGLGFDGFLGYSVVAMARKSIGLAMAMETFGSHYFGKGTHPGAIVTHPQKISAQAHENLRKSLMSTYSGLGNSHRLMLLEEGMNIVKVGIPPDESQFLESRQFQIPEVARWFNLPPHKLKDLTKSSFNNIEAEQISFVTDSILPWLVRFEQCYAMQLLSQSERNRATYYWKHIVEGLLRGDAKSRSEYYAKMFGIGAMTINEIRSKEDLDPVEGGDIHFVPLNMVSLEYAGKPPDKERQDSNNNVIPPQQKISIVKNKGGM